MNEGCSGLAQEDPYQVLTDSEVESPFLKSQDNYGKINKVLFYY